MSKKYSFLLLILVMLLSVVVSGQTVDRELSLEEAQQDIV